MNILQVVDHFGPYGGMERFIYDFTRRLQQAGAVSAVAALETDERHDWGAEPIRAVRIPGDPKAWNQWVDGFRPDLAIWHVSPGTAEIARRLGARGPVAAVAHGPVCPSGVRLFRDKDEICDRPCGSACLVRWYGRQCGIRPEPWEAVRAVRRASRMLRTLRGCARVYAVSESLKNQLAADGIEERRLRVFDNTLGEIGGPFPPLRTPGWEGSLRLLFAGRVVYGKGAQYFLQAMRHLLDRGLPVDGTVIGDGWYMGKLKRRCRELGLTRRVRFAGQVPGKDMDAWYDQTDVAVAPSIWPEPAGLVVPEARRRGKPVVVFDAGGLPEWASWMDGIYVARRADAGHLADRIVEAAVGRAEPRVFAPRRKRVDLIRELLEWSGPGDAAAIIGKETKPS